MGKRIELTEEQTKKILTLYKDELFGSPIISDVMGIHKTIVLRTLKENGVELGPSGRRNIGGKAVAQKKYESKTTVKEIRKVYNKNWSKDNRDNLIVYHSKWRDENREHIRQRARLW